MSVRVRVTLRDRLFNRRLDEGTKAGTMLAARKLRDVSRELVNRKYYAKGKRKTGSSKPGEPPMRRTGKGRRSIKSRRERGFGKKGNASTFVDSRQAKYMAMYEHGPVRIRRPFLAPSLQKHRKALFVLLATEVKKKIRR